MTSAWSLEGHNEILKCVWRWPHSWFEVTADVDFPSNILGKSSYKIFFFFEQWAIKQKSWMLEIYHSDY